MGARTKKVACGLALAGVALLAGCGGPRVVGGNVRMGYAMMDVFYGLNGHDTPVELRGNPFGEPDAVFTQRVTDAMRNRAFGIDTNFTTTPKDIGPRQYRVVIAFNPVADQRSSDQLPGRICRQPSTPTAPAAKGGPVDLYVEAALCTVGGGDLETARGWLSAASGSDSSGFRYLIGDITSTLFRGPEGDGAPFP